MPIGTLVLPNPADVREGVPYGANGTEFTGTLQRVLQVVRPPDPVPTGDNADDVHEALRRRLDDALPDAWAVYKRRDFRDLPGDQYPRAVVVLAPAQVLQEETENQVLVAYRASVALFVSEAVVQRTDPPLAVTRRAAQRAVYTTAFPSLAVEDVFLDESPAEPLPDLEQGVTSAGFTVTLALLEAREALPA